MRKIILLLALLFGFTVFGQCKVRSKVDKFEKSTMLYIDGIVINKGMKHLVLDLYKNISEKGTEYWVLTHSREGCVTKDSYLQFLTDKGETIKINHINHIDCGTSIGMFIINESELKIIQESNVTDVRLYYDYTFDLEVNEKSNERLKNALSCIIEAK